MQKNSPELDRENDVITQEDFDKLEQQENKKSLLKKLFSKDEKKEETKQEEEKPAILSTESLSFEFHQISKKLDDLMVTVEMQGGKLDMEKELRSALNERIVDLSSQLGELRSMLISKERFFDKIEDEFSRFQDMMKLVDPQKTQEEFDKKELELTKIDAKVEKNSSKMDTLQKEIDQFSKQMMKIGNFEDLISTLEKLDSKIKEIMQARDQAEQTLIKIESLYLELNKKSELIDEISSSTKENQTKLNDLERKISKVKNHLENVPKKEDIENIKKHIDVVRENVFEKEMSSLDLKKFEDELQKHSEIINKYHNDLTSSVEKIDDLEKEYDKKIKPLLNSIVQEQTKNKDLKKDNQTKLLKQLLEEKKKEWKSSMKQELVDELKRELSSTIKKELYENIKKEIESELHTYEKNISKIIKQDKKQDKISKDKQLTEQFEKQKVSSKKSFSSHKEDILEKSETKSIIDNKISLDESTIASKSSLESQLKPLVTYLEKIENKIQDVEKIRTHLLKAGWSEEQVEESIKRYKQNKKYSSERKINNEESSVQTDEDLQSLIDFLKDSKKKGVDLKKVEKKLLQVGWSEEQLQKAKQKLHH